MNRFFLAVYISIVQQMVSVFKKKFQVSDQIELLTPKTIDSIYLNHK